MKGGAIDVNDLMERIRAEAKLRAAAKMGIPLDGSESLSFPPPQQIPDPPALHIFDLEAVQTEEKGRQLVNRATQKTTVGKWIPKLFRGLWRKQGSFNEVVIDLLKLNMKSQQRVLRQLSQLTADLSAQSDWLRTIRKANFLERAWLAEIPPVIARIEHELAALKSDVVAQMHRQDRVEKLEALIDAEIKEREAMGGRVEHQQKLLESFSASVAAMSATLAGAPSRGEHDQMRSDFALLQSLLVSFEARQVADASYLKRELYIQAQRLSAFNPRQNGRMHEAATSKPNSTHQNDLDAFYIAFENEFRGTRADIKQRVRIHLEQVKRAGAGSPDTPILDLGCGRGEWIELLREEGLVCRGIDLNEFMVAECSERGLPAEQADVVEYLESLAADSQGGITAFHLIEHLPFRALLKLFRESLRVIRPGGICIFETPNPDNLQVGSNSFYLDPTHLRPLPKELTKFALSTAGFRTVSILPLHPSENSPLGQGDSPIKRFIDRIFFSEQDYAVIAHK
jgi:O-antigen chain-terminating methyltransferase